MSTSREEALEAALREALAVADKYVPINAFETDWVFERARAALAMKPDDGWMDRALKHSSELIGEVKDDSDPTKWKLVPVVLTDAMLDAGEAEMAKDGAYVRLGRIYRAMLAAAPQPSLPEEAVELVEWLRGFAIYGTVVDEYADEKLRSAADLIERMSQWCDRQYAKRV